MLTPQEVASRAFPKAVMGGYNMASVDEFLDELSDDYSALYKENAALKSKLKVLVEKVEDYRATEDSMRATLLTAQKMADSIVKEAEQKRDGMLAQAKDEAQAQMGELDRQRRESEARLAQGKQELADFIATARSACEKELEFLSRLDGLAVVPEAPGADQQADAAAETEGVEPGQYYWEEYRDIAAKWADYAVNFDGEGMTVTFAPYEIACYAAGTQEFRLDRDFLGQYLSAEGLRLLGYGE